MTEGWLLGGRRVESTEEVGVPGPKGPPRALRVRKGLDSKEEPGVRPGETDHPLRRDGPTGSEVLTRTPVVSPRHTDKFRGAGASFSFPGKS